MKKATVTVRNKLGLHARPASMIVDTAMKFSGDIKLIMDDIVADAKSILSIMMLAAEKGSVLEIQTSNCDDDQKALDSIVSLFDNKFDED